MDSSIKDFLNRYFVKDTPIKNLKNLVISEKTLDFETKSMIIRYLDKNPETIPPEIDKILYSIENGYELYELGCKFLSKNEYESASASFCKASRYGSANAVFQLQQMLIDNHYDSTDNVITYLNSIPKFDAGIKTKVNNLIRSSIIYDGSKDVPVSEIIVQFINEGKIFYETTVNRSEDIVFPTEIPESSDKYNRFLKWQTDETIKNDEQQAITYIAIYSQNDSNNNPMIGYWNNLAFSYLNKENRLISDSTDVCLEAYRCFEKASELSDKDAKFNMAIMIENGLVNKPLITAYEIYYDLFLEGDFEAQERMHKLSSLEDAEFYSELYTFYTKRGNVQSAQKYEKYTRSIYKTSCETDETDLEFDILTKDKEIIVKKSPPNPNVVKPKKTTNQIRYSVISDRYKDMGFRQGYYGNMGSLFYNSGAFER